jgi:hypothetical protein
VVLGSEWDELEQRNRRVQETPQRVFVLGAVVAAAFFGWARFFSDGQEPASTIAVLDASVVELPGTSTLQTTEPQKPDYREAPPARTGRESYVGIYECVVDGQRVVSDRPCAADAKSRTLVVDQPDPREIARLRQQQSQAQRQASRTYTSQPGSAGEGPSVAGSAEPSNARACAAVDRAIDNINSRMRAGYGPEEGEWLRAEWHRLKRERYSLQCGR